MDFLELQPKLTAIELLGISMDHLKRLAALPKLKDHKDSFDRLNVAQAIQEDALLVSADTTLDAYGVRRLWS